MPSASGGQAEALLIAVTKNSSGVIWKKKKKTTWKINLYTYKKAELHHN